MSEIVYEKEESTPEVMKAPIYLQFVGIIEKAVVTSSGPIYAFLMADSNNQRYIAEFQCQPNYMKGIMKAMSRMRFVPLEVDEVVEKKTEEEVKISNIKVPKILSAGDNDE